MLDRLRYVVRREMRPRVEWMVACDDWILDALEETGMALSPKVLSHNIGYSRQYIARRLRVLEANDIVDREARGLYRLSELGQQYLQGEIGADELEPDASD